MKKVSNNSPNLGKPPFLVPKKTIFCNLTTGFDCVRTLYTSTYDQVCFDILS